MAEVRGGRIDGQGDDRKRPGRRGVPLADESPDELPALMTIGLGVAFLVIAIVWPTIQAGRDRGAAPAPDAEVTADAGHGDGGSAEEDEAAEEAVDGPDLPTIEADLTADGYEGLALAADGRIVTVSGEVPDEAARTAVLAFVAGRPNVDDVVDRLTVEARVGTATGPSADIAAAQRSIVLTGTVPDQATRDALVERAIEIYSADQVDDQLRIDEGLAPPARVTITGSLTDPVLFDKVRNGFGDLPGVEVVQPSITLEEPSDLERSLNELGSIQFISGSGLIEPESVPILDRAAELLTANPDVAVEIGGHTDSVGSDASNLGLSEDRADRVKAELEARGVTNEMVAEGFGERRLKVENDANDAEAQQQNRRVEFRVLN